MAGRVVDVYGPGTNTLTDAATVAIDCSYGLQKTLSTTLSRAFGVPTNGEVGMLLELRISNAGGGPITPTYDAVFDLAGGAGPTIAAGKQQVIAFRKMADGNWYETYRTVGLFADVRVFDRAPTDDDYVEPPPPGTRASDVVNHREYIRQSDGTWMWVEVSS